MVSNRIIARLDIKGESVVKGIQMDGLRKVGEPEAIAQHMSSSGADELLLVDVVAALYNRDYIYPIIEFVASDLRIPLTVVGGIRNTDNAAKIFDAGAEKIGINSAGMADPRIYETLANKYGSQAIVASIESKKDFKRNSWIAMVDNGRTPTGYEVLDWCSSLHNYGVGEILVTSVDADGMQKGPDLALVDAIGTTIKVPFVYGGGVRDSKDCAALLSRGVDAVAIASALHYKKMSIAELKTELKQSGYRIRVDEEQA
jgi:cyclase